MRRTLKIYLVAILLIAVAPTMAQVVWSGGVSVTDRTDLAAISSACNASRYGRPIGSTDTSMGLQTVVTAHSSMSYEASLSTVGIPTDKIVDVVLTPDNGTTVWYPIFIKGQGYTITIPIGNNTMVETRVKRLQLKKHPHDKDVWDESTEKVCLPGLTPGKMAKLEWKLAVRDGRRTINIVFIPLTFSFTRKLSLGFSFMVQQAMPEFDYIPNSVEGDHATFSYLRGFIPAWASPDPAEILRQKMVNDIINPPQVVQPVQSQPQPVQPQADPVPPVVVQPQCQHQPVQPQPQPQPQCEHQSQHEEKSSLPAGITIIGSVKVETVISSAPSVQIVKSIVSIVVWKDAEKRICPPQLINLARYKVGQIIEFKYGTQLVCAAEVTKVEKSYDLLEMRIFRGDWPSAGCTFDVVEEAN